jgi:hypothetical protein
MDTLAPQLYPDQTEALAKAKLIFDLPVACQCLTSASSNATATVKQTLTINDRSVLDDTPDRTPQRSRGLSPCQANAGALVV